MDQQIIANVILFLMIAMAIAFRFLSKIIANKFNVAVTNKDILNKFHLILGILGWMFLFIIPFYKNAKERLGEYLIFFIIGGILVIALLFVLLFRQTKKTVPALLYTLIIIFIGPLWLLAMGFGKV